MHPTAAHIPKGHCHLNLVTETFFVFLLINEPMIAIPYIINEISVHVFVAPSTSVSVLRIADGIYTTQANTIQEINTTIEPAIKSLFFVLDNNCLLKQILCSSTEA
jgi:hypothetical protein